MMLPLLTLDPLPIARYRLTARMRQGVRLPDYAGSLLRGQFGAALRNVACMTRQPTCGGCPLLASCPYTRIFESLPPPSHALQAFSAIPNAFVIEPPLPPDGLLHARPQPGQTHPADLGQGAELVFHMVLVGAAIDQLALVVFAWQRALAQGLTKSRSPADLLQVDWVDAHGHAHPIWSQAHPVLAAHPASLSVPAMPTAASGTGPTTALHLHIHTPLRLQHQGQPLRPTQLMPRTLVAAVARRVALVLEFHAQQPHWGAQVPATVAQAQTLTDTRQLHWFDWVRYSSRQQQEMTLGGVLGTWALLGHPEALAAAWPWLWLGQWLHVGKNATMGMGGYTLSAR
jgi:hypothetical protein